MPNSASRRRLFKRLALPIFLSIIGLSVLVAAPLSRLAPIAALIDSTGTRTYFPVLSKSQPTPIWRPVPACTPSPSPLTPTAGPGSSVPPQPDVIRIARIIFNPDGDELAGEYVRLESLRCTPIQLSGWSLSDSDGNSYQFPPSLLPPSGFLRVWVKGGTGTVTDQYWGLSEPIWDNDGDTAYLKDRYSIVSRCGYAGGGSVRYCP